MRRVLENWRIPENEFALKFWDGLYKNWEERWGKGKNIEKRKVIEIPEISEKQKEEIRNVFANITQKRISFSNSKRLLHITGLYAYEFELEKIKIPDAVIYPLNGNEIQDILIQAKGNKTGIRLSEMSSAKKRMPDGYHQSAIISLELMQKIIRFEPETYSVTVQTGIQLYALQKFLSESGWQLPVKITGRSYQTMHEVLNHSTILHPYLLKGTVHTFGGEIQFSEEDSRFKSLFLNPKETNGIFSEITLTVTPKPKHVRNITALLPNLKSAADIINQLKYNQIEFHSCFIADTENLKFLLRELPEKNINKAGNLFLTLMKNPEELFKEQDEQAKSVVFSIDFNEYQHSTTSLLIHAKDLIQQNSGEILTGKITDTLEKWSDWYAYTAVHAKDLQLDTYHYSVRVPYRKMEDYRKVIHNKLGKNSFYAKNKKDFVLHFSEYNYPYIQLNLYIIASSVHRKKPDTPKALTDFFEELFMLKNSSAPASDFNHKLLEVVKKEISNSEYLTEKSKTKTILSSVLNPGS